MPHLQAEIGICPVPLGHELAPQIDLFSEELADGAGEQMTPGTRTGAEKLDLLMGCVHGIAALR